MTTPKLADALARARLVHARAALMPAIERMGQQIGHDYKGLRPVFMTVMHGGLIFAGHLALAIPIDLEFDYLHATRYRGATSGGEIHWLRQPSVRLRRRHVLLVDDIFDEGHTMAAIREYCQGQGAASVKIAVLCVKQHERRVPGLDVDYVGVEVPDRYVFGFGMDFHEQGRNLPGIYAI
jgi:hypoxanthine phosphoribosyltransferase